MKNFKLSRKRKKQYKKDLFNRYGDNKKQCLAVTLIEEEGKFKLKSYFIKQTPKTRRERENSLYSIYNTFNNWNWFYHKDKVEVNCIHTVFNDGADSCTNEELLQWYKDKYPDNKLKQHWCKVNRYKYYEN